MTSTSTLTLYTWSGVGTVTSRPQRLLLARGRHRHKRLLTLHKRPPKGRGCKPVSSCMINKDVLKQEAKEARSAGECRCDRSRGANQCVRWGAPRPDSLGDAVAMKGALQALARCVGPPCRGGTGREAKSKADEGRRAAAPGTGARYLFPQEEADLAKHELRVRREGLGRRGG